jgi:hypothetical protein
MPRGKGFDSRISNAHLIWILDAIIFVSAVPIKKSIRKQYNSKLTVDLQRTISLSHGVRLAYLFLLTVIRWAILG